MSAPYNALVQPPPSMRADAWLDLRANLPTTVGHRVFHSGGWGRMPDGRKLRALRDLVHLHGRDPRLRNWVVQEVLRPVGGEDMQRDYPRQAAALLKWVQDGILYVNETGEQIQAPLYTLRVAHGDCDDEAVLLASMAESIRLPWRFALAGRARDGTPVRWAEPVADFRLPGEYTPRGGATVASGAKPPRGVKWTHIYLRLGWPPYAPTTWASAEPTVKGAPLGYDVVEHGVVPDAHLQGRTPGGLPEMGAVDADGAPTQLLPAVFYHVKRRFTLPNLIVAILEALVVGGLVGFVLRRRRRRR